MTPYGLQTEQRTEPLGLDEPRPRLSWKLRSDRRGAAQSAYRITAAARAADLDLPDRLMWDSGRRTSGETLLIGWAGPALHSSTRYHWRVETWDETGAPAGTAQSWFETGLLHRDDWAAVWIGRDPVSLPLVDPPTDEQRSFPNPAAAPLYLRREFELAERPVRAAVIRYALCAAPRRSAASFQDSRGCGSPRPSGSLRCSEVRPYGLIPSALRRSR